MMPLTQTLLRRIFPPAQQTQALGLWSMTTVVAPIAGPLLGGQLVDGVGWPWIFFINVPVAIIVAVFAWRALAKHETLTERIPVDFVGLALLITWVGAMQIMLDKGKDLDWFDSPFIVTLALIAVIGFVAFLIWELTEEHPVVDLRGYGRSRGRTGAFTLEEAAADVLALGDALGLTRFAVVGHSMSPLVALHLAPHHALHLVGGKRIVELRCAKQSERVGALGLRRLDPERLFQHLWQRVFPH